MWPGDSPFSPWNVWRGCSETLAELMEGTCPGSAGPCALTVTVTVVWRKGLTRCWFLKVPTGSQEFQGSPGYHHL